jgi:hypothetical protein
MPWPTTDDLSSCMRRGFRWVPASAEELASPAVSCPSWPHPAKHCKNQTLHPHMTFQPAQRCRSTWSRAGLDRATISRALAGRTLRFIGDSATLDHFRYFTRCLLNCSFQEMKPGPFELTEAMAEVLREVGFPQAVVAGAFHHIAISFAKDGFAHGCKLENGGRVEFRRLNALPETRRPPWPNLRIMAATMHTLLYLPNTTRLTERDIVVMNVGLHRTSELPSLVSSMLRWWEGERAAGRGPPQLFWRQTSPQHWPTSPEGMFRSFDDVKATANRSCRASTSEGATQRAAILYDLNVSSVIHQAQALGFAHIIPTLLPTWMRADDHPTLTSGALPGKFTRSSGAIAKLQDCTHYCATGSSLRFWSHALVAWLQRLTAATWRERGDAV